MRLAGDGVEGDAVSGGRVLRGPVLLPNAAWREGKNAFARAAGVRRSIVGWLGCVLGRHEWFLDGGSVEEPRYASDEPRYFCARPHCEARKGPW